MRDGPSFIGKSSRSSDPFVTSPRPLHGFPLVALEREFRQSIKLAGTSDFNEQTPAD